MFIFPFNDFLIAMSFTGIYYYQGKNELVVQIDNNIQSEETRT